LIKIKSNFKKKAVAVAIATSIGFATPVIIAADNTTSNLIGSIEAYNLTGITVTAKNTETGTSRTININNSTGSFHFTKLPSGVYEVSVHKNDTVIAKDTFRVSLGSNTSAVFNLDADDRDANTVTVLGKRVSNIDVTSMDSGLVLGESELDSMPIARNLSSVTLLAPGVVLGDNKFGGGFTSFGGSSVAENSCYINGLDVTNTRQGLGCGSVPFEFYKEFQVKTGGYSAMYGRSTGGVVNSTTKSGTNIWEFSAAINYSPDYLEDGSVSRANGGTGDIFRDTRDKKSTLAEYIFTAGGPIIDDKLFVYAIVNPRDSEFNYATFPGSDEGSGITEFRERESSGSDNMFWGTKLDWDITDNHRLSYFAYSNQSSTDEAIYARDPSTGVKGALMDNSVRDRGGKAQSLSYVGHITDDLTISVMTGEINTEFTTNIANVDCPSE